MAEALLSPAPRSILVVNVCRIGDTLLATPALRALARAWPEAQITVLGHPKRVEMLENLDRKSTRLNSSHIQKSRMPSSA